MCKVLSIGSKSHHGPDSEVLLIKVLSAPARLSMHLHTPEVLQPAGHLPHCGQHKGAVHTGKRLLARLSMPTRRINPSMRCADPLQVSTSSCGAPWPAMASWT